MRRVFLLVLLAGALLPGATALASGPVTHDTAAVQVQRDGSATVDRRIEYEAFLAERGAGDRTTIERRARDGLTAFGAQDISLQVDSYPDRVRLHVHYRLPAEAVQRSDDYLVQHVLRDPLPVAPELVVNYPLDIRAVRVARITLPGTVRSFTPYRSRRLAPFSSVTTSVRLENGTTAIVQTREVVRPGDLVDQATIDGASLATLTYVLSYHPSTWNWLAIAALAVSVVLVVTLAIPVTQLERITEPFPNPGFNRTVAGVVAACGAALAVCALVLYALSGPVANGIQQAVSIVWPQSDGTEVSLLDLSGTIMTVAVVLLLTAWGLSARKTVARLFVLALTLVLAAEVFHVLVAWLPLPEYVPLQLFVLFATGEVLLVAAALTLRQLGSSGMRAHYAA